MSLEALGGLFGWRVARDAVVESFGFVESPVARRLVFANDARFLRRAAADPSIAFVERRGSWWLYRRRAAR